MILVGETEQTLVGVEAYKGFLNTAAKRLSSVAFGRESIIWLAAVHESLGVLWGKMEVWKLPNKGWCQEFWERVNENIGRQTFLQ